MESIRGEIQCFFLKHSVKHTEVGFETSEILGYFMIEYEKLLL